MFIQKSIKMRNKHLSKQYEQVVSKFDLSNQAMNKKSCSTQRRLLHTYVLSKLEKPLRILDLGCGAGDDLKFFENKGFLCAGVDSSKEMCKISGSRIPKADIRNENFTCRMSFKDQYFQLIISKWAMQTAGNILPIHKEVYRLLESGGYYGFLVVHPLRQFLEKKHQKKDYFKKEIVESHIFDKQIIVYEPTHTMKEYLSPWFLKHFALIHLHEGYEFPAAEQIGGDVYPTYLIVIARKK